MRKNSKKRKMQIPALIALGLLIVTLIIIYIMFGSHLTLFLVLGSAIIIGINGLFNLVKGNKKKRRLLNAFLILFFVLAIAVCVGVTGFCVYIVKETPAFDIAKLTRKEASILYAADNTTEIGKFGTELRENISYDDLPEVFIDALIATEDSRFFQHNGFDAPRFVSASFGQLIGRNNAGGASTLTMQLSKNTFTDPGQNRSEGLDGIIRKFEDIYLAVFKLEKNYTKEEIIEYYVNNLSLANNAWGVEQESQVLFGKSVTDLNLSEAALLVGIFNNPTKYNPITNPNRAAGRRNSVLVAMMEHGYITKEEADLASDIPVEKLLADKKNNLAYQGYIDTVWEELMSKYGINPNTTPVLVYTNMDINRQAALDQIFNGETYKWIDEDVQGGVSVIDHSNGKVVAVGAGRNKTTALSLNFATFYKQNKRQIGSTAKPIFDYGPAIEYLNYSTYQQIIDEPYAYSSGQQIGNSDNLFKGPISLRQSLSESRNIPALKTFHAVESAVGNKKIAEFATNLGITPERAPNGTIYESHALGAFTGSTPMEMAAAYAAFANGGTYYEPTTINKIVYRDTNEVVNVKVEGKKVMSEATAFMITDMLKTSVQSGAAGGLAQNGVKLAAKTGTTNFTSETKKTFKLSGDAVNDYWVIGYDPEYVIGMWYGYEKILSNHHNRVATGGERGRLFRALENVIMNKNSNGKDFQMPNSVSKICVEKGHMDATLPSEYTPEDQITCEYFKKGTEPSVVSTSYSRLEKPLNVKVDYDKDKEKITITWDKVQKPEDAEVSYGEFGYNVYYENVLLGFTADNSYTISANTNISGTYSVETSYEVYTNNKSDKSSVKYEYKVATEENSEEDDTTTPKPTSTVTP